MFKKNNLIKTVLFYFIIFPFINSILNAQSDNKFHIAFKIAPALNWYWGYKQAEKYNGTVLRFSSGIELVKGFKNIALITGVFYETAGGKVKYNNSGDISSYTTFSRVKYMYNVSESKILEQISYDFNYQSYLDGNTNFKNFLLNERNYQLTYIKFPLTFVLKEKLPYKLDGSIGINYSYLLKAQANDNVTDILFDRTYFKDYLGKNEEIKNLDISPDVVKHHLKLNIGVSKSEDISKHLFVKMGINYSVGLTQPFVAYSNQLLFEFETDKHGYYGPLLHRVIANGLTFNVSLVW